MKKNIPNAGFLLSKMKSRLLPALIVISVFSFHTAFAQGVLNNPVTIELKQETLKNALDKIATQGKVSFTYGGNVLQNRSKVSLSASNKPLKNVLDELLRPFPLKYTALENKIIIREDESRITPSSSADSLFKINGRVFDTGEPPIPLPGTTVIVKGESRATTTDDKGNFELKVRIGEVLIFSHTGYKPFEYPVINNRDNLTIALPENVSTLDQVVVTGYSEQKMKHLANSISALNVKSNIEGKPITQLSQALQGGITGLTVTQSSGLPGGDAAAIKIRGISTLGTTAPLVLVDGVPTNINDVDPVTVESVTVLKDAAAAAIYGSRAANGVIIVTTKRGQAGQVHIVYDGFAGFQKAAYLPEFVDAPTYMEMVNAAQTNIGGNPIYTNDVIQKTREGVDPLLYPNTDWKKLVLKNQAFSQQHSIGVTGGNSQARFAVNGTYLQQDGIINQTSAERYSLRANTSVTLRKNLSMYLDLSLTRKETSRPINRYTNFQDGDGAGYILYETFRIPPNIVSKYPLRADGYQAYGNYAEMLNPVAELEKGGFTKSREDNISINFQPQWEILPGLKLKGQYLFRLLSTGNITSRDAYNFLDYYTNALLFQYGSTHTSAIYKRNYQYMAATLDYTRTYNKHTIYAVGGITRETDNPDQSNQFAEATLASYFVKVNYIFNDKYLLESTLRADGSSKFGPGNKWGYFPSVAAGWNVHKEPFMKDVKFISNLKLRTSYGLLGNNQGIGLYKYQSTTNTNGTEATIGNPDLTWESVKMLDAGVDVGLLNDKLSFTFDWFNKLTENILLNAPLSYSSGIGPQPINAGSVRNKGWEFAMNYATNIKVVSLGINAGYSYYKNSILTLKDGPYYDKNTIQKEGLPIGSAYGYRTMGLLQQKDVDAGVPMIGSKTPSGPTQVAGDIRYMDLNNDGTITEADQTIIGNTNPQGNYFLNLRLGFKNFDVETLLNGFTASDVFYTGRYITPLNLSGGGGTPMVWQQDTWTPANTDAAYPRITPSPADNARFSDYWRTQGAFVRVRFIQLGYTIKSPLFTRAGITNARIYFNTQNPFTFTGMKYLDPETKGSDNTYPLMRFYTLGVNIKL